MDLECCNTSLLHLLKMHEIQRVSVPQNWSKVKSILYSLEESKNFLRGILKEP